MTGRTTAPSLRMERAYAACLQFVLVPFGEQCECRTCVLICVIQAVRSGEVNEINAACCACGADVGAGGRLGVYVCVCVVSPSASLSASTVVLSGAGPVWRC